MLRHTPMTGEDFEAMCCLWEQVAYLEQRAFWYANAPTGLIAMTDVTEVGGGHIVRNEGTSWDASVREVVWDTSAREVRVTDDGVLWLSCPLPASQAEAIDRRALSCA